MNRLKKIEGYISVLFLLEEDFLHKPTQERNYTDARKIMCKILRDEEKLSINQVTKYMKYKSHATVIHHLRRFDALYQTEPVYRDKVDRVFKHYHTIIQHEDQNLQHTTIEGQHMVADSNAANY